MRSGKRTTGAHKGFKRPGTCLRRAGVIWAMSARMHQPQMRSVCRSLGRNDNGQVASAGRPLCSRRAPLAGSAIGFLVVRPILLRATTMTLTCPHHKSIAANVPTLRSSNVTWLGPQNQGTRPSCRTRDVCLIAAAKRLKRRRRHFAISPDLWRRHSFFSLRLPAPQCERTFLRLRRKCTEIQIFSALLRRR
jgi:hypothetical protein